MDKIKLNKQTADAIIEVAKSFWFTTRGLYQNFIPYIKSLVSEDEEQQRTMTPFEHQWMDFKKILSELVVFQKDYEKNTRDKCPGNEYYSGKLLVIVNRAKHAISSLVSKDDGLPCKKCGYAKEQCICGLTGNSLVEQDNDVREQLAEYAHNAWAGWMKYLFEKSTLNNDGTVTIPKWAVERWTMQANTHYHELPEEMKPADREEADRMIQIFKTRKVSDG